MRVFLDANVLARPVTRTLLVAGSADQADIEPVWSSFAEDEATRHLRPRAKPLWFIRQLYGWKHSPPGTAADRFVRTDPKDRQILADTAASGAGFLITANIADFAVEDLQLVGVSAVDPDLFMSCRLSKRGYVAALNVLARTRTNPPASPGELHALIARNHPLLFAAHRDSFPFQPAESPHLRRQALFRGYRCLLCERTTRSGRPPNALGVGPECEQTQVR